MDRLHNSCDRTHTILVVDDDLSIRFLTVLGLLEANFRVIEADDGVAAIEILDAKNVDAVVTDLQMPRMSGVELLQYVQQRYPKLPVFCMTSGITFTSEVLSLGARGFFRKPLDTKVLAEAISEAISINITT